MRHRLTVIVIALFVLGLALPVFGDAHYGMWFGRWRMDHDGHLGELIIWEDTRPDDPERYWKYWQVVYRLDGTQEWRKGRISRVSDHNQHMELEIDFGDYKQPFDLYLFSWNPIPPWKFAGTCKWGGRTFGVCAQFKGVYDGTNPAAPRPPL